jgi:YegS/Rv2252/BmrU family lipid kinase
VAEGFDTIIAAGGDGTVNEVVNGIGDAPGGFDRARLGVLPLGTVNVFARELGISPDFKAAWAVIQAGAEARVDLPLAEFSINGREARRYFIQLGGAGLDSRAIELVSWKWKQRVGPLAYVLSGVKAFFQEHPVVTVAESPGVPVELVLLGNGRYYGGSFAVFPHASLRDGLLDVCLYPKVNLGQLLKVGLGLASGKFHRFATTQQMQLPAVTLTSKSRVLLELDGENVGELPARISVAAALLRVIVPR